MSHRLLESGILGGKCMESEWLIPRVAILTPPGRAAIATVAIWGRAAEALVAKQFVARSGRPLEDSPIARIMFGQWRHDSAAIVEEEVVVVRKAPSVVEVHCHGGAVAARSIVQGMVRNGATECDGDEWVRSQANGNIEAEALLQLAATESQRTAGVLLDQCRGALRRALETAKLQLLREMSSQATDCLRELARVANVGQHLSTPWRVVVAGRPNAGKSSLVNRLLGFDRSIVHDEPGTTRDRVSTRMILDGWPFELFDTAGLRAADESLEATGIELAHQAMQAADLVVWVHDVSETANAEPIDISGPIVCVANKSDLVDDLPANLSSWVVTSAHSGEGVSELKESIVAQVVPAPPRPGDPVPFTAEQASVIERACDLVGKGESARVEAAELLQSLLSAPLQC